MFYLLNDQSMKSLLTGASVCVAANQAIKWQVSSAKKVTSEALCKFSMIAALLLMLAGCVSEYTVHPSRRGWAKPGVSYVDARNTWDECIAMMGGTTEIESYMNKCMAKQGFVFKKELSNDENPPCWYDSHPPCKDESRPADR